MTKCYFISLPSPPTENQMEIKKTAIENFVQCLTCNIQVGEAVRGSVATRRKAVQWISLI